MSCCISKKLYSHINVLIEFESAVRDKTWREYDVAAGKRNIHILESMVQEIIEEYHSIPQLRFPLPAGALMKRLMNCVPDYTAEMCELMDQQILKSEPKNVKTVLRLAAGLDEIAPGTSTRVAKRVEVMVDHLVKNLSTWLRRCLAEPSVDQMWPQIVSAVHVLALQRSIATDAQRPKVLEAFTHAYHECSERVIGTLEPDKFLFTKARVDDVMRIGEGLDAAVPPKTMNPQTVARLEEKLLVVGKEVVETYSAHCDQALFCAEAIEELDVHLPALRDSITNVVCIAQWASRVQCIAEYSHILSALATRCAVLVDRAFSRVLSDMKFTFNDEEQLIRWATVVDAVNKAVETGEFQLTLVEFANASGAAPTTRASGPAPEQTSSSLTDAVDADAGPLVTKLRSKQAQENQEPVETDGSKAGIRRPLGAEQKVAIGA